MATVTKKKSRAKIPKGDKVGINPSYLTSNQVKALNSATGCATLKKSIFWMAEKLDIQL